jgi:hypothetical protein
MGLFGPYGDTVWAARLWYGSGYVSLPANWGFDRAAEAVRDSYRAPAGTLHAYDHGFFTVWRIDCDFVPAADAAVVNSWWQTGCLCRLEISSDGASAVWSVQIVNDKSPFDAWAKANADRRNGTVELSTY